MPSATPRSYAGHFRVASYVLGGAALLMLLLSLSLRVSPDGGLQLFAQACRVLLPWALGLALLSGLLAYALRPVNDGPTPTGDSTEFAPDATEFGRTQAATDHASLDDR